MGKIAIRIEELSKQYHIKPPPFFNKNLRDLLESIILHPLHKHKERHKKNSVNLELFWALKDVSFDVEQGEVLGIIGNNGSGKSTLLKILSRVTNPTAGLVEIYGRVGSLLEVGTGFHPELTGRENIYLNGAILGLKKIEIDRRFDEIVSFAEVETFLDMPIKHYSSGMCLRLAFSVAAHLRSEILLLDEVLTVGDARFQKKCITRMNESIREGKTILIVSHNMSFINAFCPRVILIEKGMIMADGQKDSVIKKYMNLGRETSLNNLSIRKDRQGTGIIMFKEFHLENGKKERVNVLTTGEDAVIAMGYCSSIQVNHNDVSASFIIKDQLGFPVSALEKKISQNLWHEIPPNGIFKCLINNLPLVPGTYNFDMFVQIGGIVSDIIINAGKFDVVAGDFFGTGKFSDSKLGAVMIRHEWMLD